MRLFGASLLVLLTAASALAEQQAGAPVGPAVLRVTVLDQTGAVVPGATVSVAGAEDATKRGTPGPVVSDRQGVALVIGLRPGRYAVETSFPGFQTRVLAGVRLRAGENTVVAMLEIERLETAVTVGL